MTPQTLLVGEERQFNCYVFSPPAARMECDQESLTHLFTMNLEKLEGGLHLFLLVSCNGRTATQRDIFHESTREKLNQFIFKQAVSCLAQYVDFSHALNDNGTRTAAAPLICQLCGTTNRVGAVDCEIESSFDSGRSNQLMMRAPLCANISSDDHRALLFSPAPGDTIIIFIVVNVSIRLSWSPAGRAVANQIWIFLSLSLSPIIPTCG